MTELSYTAWDDNKYQWPPPQGWYQASDGKWWPEGYGPVAADASGDPAAEANTTEVASTGIDTDGRPADEGFDMVQPDTEVDADASGAGWTSTDLDGTVDESLAGEHVAGEHVGGEHMGGEHVGGEHVGGEGPAGEHEGGEFESGYNAAIAEVGGSPEATADAAAGFAVDAEPMPEAPADETSEYQVPDADHAVDLDEGPSGFAESTETAHPSEPAYETESPYSTSSAGMAASGFAPRAEGGSSSLGLAGWAQTGAGASDIGNRVDVSHEYDYSAPEGEPDDLLDPIEVSDDADGLDLDGPSGEAANLDAPDVDTSGLEATDLDTADLDTADLDRSPIDAPGEPVDSPLDRLDDLKRQVEQQSFTDHVGAADAATPVADLERGFDPTETLDIDPNDLTLESNPFYGGAEETAAYAATPAVGTDDRADASAFNGDHGVAADTTADQGYPDQVEPPSESYGYNAAGDATIEAPATAETLGYGYEGEPPAADPTMPVGDGFGAPQGDYSGVPALTPTSTPTPPARSGRVVLYAIIGLLALAVAGIAGYVLYQLQSDDGGESGGDAGTTVADGGDAGPSDLSGQDPGSFSNPHELAGGVRLTVPVSENETEVWMLQVREPAAASDAGDDLVEVTSRIRIRNDSANGDLSASGLRFVLVSADGSTGTTAAAGCSAGDDLNRQAAIEPGQDIEGNVCWQVPAAQATGALLGVESVHAGGRVHVQLS